MKVYTTLTRKKELLNKKKLNLFVCGPTVYDLPHIGHAKTYVQFDFIVKYLRKKGIKVFYLQNITDLDDKIIQRAKEKNTTPEKLAKKFEDAYYKDMKALKIDSVTKYARATDFIPEIINQVNNLIKKGFAYKIEDGYYFNISKFKDYGKLSKRKVQQAEDALTRIDNSINKKNKGDFCLWKLSKEKPNWDSELGKGRPGWHIEDTAITEKYFGPQYDIHGGALDLIFPHHEAEISQMEASSGKKPLVKYWMHTGFLNIRGEKMSKSLGNFFTIRDILKKFDYKTIRFAFISNHYKNPMDFSREILNQSKNSLDRLNDLALNSKNKTRKMKESEIKKYKKQFYKELDDDFNTPKAFSVLFDFVRTANKLKAGDEAFQFLKEIHNLCDILTLKQNIPKEIIKLAEERKTVREDKNWKESDKLRGKILKKGYLIEDKGDNYKIKNV
jgi:cysteinyl-tRNA synthetase